MRALPTFLAFALLVLEAAAHPIPDIPVRAAFSEGGRAKIVVEINPRCFETEPTQAPSLLQTDFALWSKEQREALETKTEQYVKDRLAFYLEPLGQVVPDLVFDFVAQQGVEETEDAGKQVMVLQGTWETTIPSGVSGYSIKALETGNLAVQFLNEVNGQTVERMQVLFPGEKSYALDLTSLASKDPASKIEGAVAANDSGWWASFLTFLRQGFVHVLPLGLDHILFVLGLFLLSRQIRPLIYQVSCFTVAHTVTLALATLGWVSSPGKVVEPLIALSISVVAIENIFHPRYTHWRLLVVFFFGLIHGLGFAGALSDLELPVGSLVAALLGFNAGVELGQLAVIALAFVATAWLRNPATYRKLIVIPGSIAIALMGLWWFVQRVFFES